MLNNTSVIEVETKVYKVFTITEKALIEPRLLLVESGYYPIHI